jgi:hypothetical protein
VDVGNAVEAATDWEVETKSEAGREVDADKPAVAGPVAVRLAESESVCAEIWFKSGRETRGNGAMQSVVLTAADDSAVPSDGSTAVVDIGG